MKIKKNQKGIILIATLMMTVILAGITITLAVVPTGDQKAANNSQLQQIAQQAADAAIAEARNWIKRKWNNTAALPTGTCSYPDSLQLKDSSFSLANYPTQPTSWWSTNGCSASFTPPGAAQAPQYVLKQLGYNISNGAFIYQIVARAAGPTTNIVAYSEQIFTVDPGNGNLSNVNAGTPGAKLSAPSAPPTNYMPSNFWLPLGGSQWIAGGGFPAWTVQGCWCCCPDGWPVGFGCQRDAMGRLRIWGTTTCSSCIDPNDPSFVPACSTQYGPWVPASGGTSSIQMCVKVSSNPNTTPTLQTYSCSQ